MHPRQLYSLGVGLQYAPIVETLLFYKQWPVYWTEEERGAFASYLAKNPEAGDVVPKSGGMR